MHQDPHFTVKMQTQGTQVSYRSAREPSSSCISYVPVLRTSWSLHPTICIGKHITPSKRGTCKGKREERGQEGRRWDKRRGKGTLQFRVRDGVGEWEEGETGRRGEGGKEEGGGKERIQVGKKGNKMKRTQKTKQNKGESCFWIPVIGETKLTRGFPNLLQDNYTHWEEKTESCLH